MIEVSKPTMKNSILGGHSYTKEISFGDLEACDHGDCLQINNIKTFDFHSFDKIVRERKRAQFKTEEEFQNYKRNILNSTQNGTCDLPLISISGNNIWTVLDGKIRLLAYKVLGVNPVVEFLSKK